MYYQQQQFGSTLCAYGFDGHVHMVLMVTIPIPRTTSTPGYCTTMHLTRSPLVVWHVQAHFRRAVPAWAVSVGIAAISTVISAAAAATAAACCAAAASGHDMAAVVVTMVLPLDGQPHQLVFSGCLSSPETA
jgi:hypothetical protein